MKQKLKRLVNYLYQKPELVFVLIALPFGLFSAIAVPQMSVTDENSHLLRIYQLSQGEVICKNKTSYPQEVIDKSKSGKVSLRKYTMDLSDKIGDSGHQEYGCGSAATYSPLAYLPHVLGAIFSYLFHPTVASLVLMARIGSLLFYIASIYWIIKKVRFGKYVFFVIALIPQMIHLAASLSSDMMNNVVALGLVAVTINLFVQQSKISKKQIGVLTSLIILAFLLKTNLVILLLPLLFLPARIFKENKFKGVPFNIQKWSLAGVAGTLAGGLYLLWSSLTVGDASSVAGAPNPIAEQPRLFINLLFNTYFSDYGDVVLRGMFGDFSSFLYHFPTILLIAQAILLFIVFTYRSEATNQNILNKKLIISMLVSFVVSILTVTYVLYTAWALKRGIADHADGVQGRYFTALLVLLIPFFAWVGKYISVRAKSDKLMFAVIVAVQVSLLGFYVLYTIKTLADII